MREQAYTPGGGCASSTAVLLRSLRPGPGPTSKTGGTQRKKARKMRAGDWLLGAYQRRRTRAKANNAKSDESAIKPHSLIVGMGAAPVPPTGTALKLMMT